MPRKKVTPKRRDGPVESPRSEPKKKKQKWKIRKKLLRSYPDEAIRVGSGPVSCLWVKDEKISKIFPEYLVTEEKGGDEIQINTEFPEGVIVPIIEAHNVIEHILSIGPRQSYAFVCVETLPHELLIDVCVTALPLANATNVIEYLYSRDYSEFVLDNDLREDEGWTDFFKELSQIQAKRLKKEENVYQHSDLRPKLRGYQAAAVEWMISREQRPLSTLDTSWLNLVADPVDSRGGPPLMYNKYSGVLSQTLESITIASGGILADEMGLGKTVITLALFLNHQRPPVEIPSEFIPLQSGDSDSDSAEEDSDSDTSVVAATEIERNQENCLNATEQLQLVPTKPRRNVLRSKLTEWYNSMLAEVSTPRRTSVVERPRTFKCICGDGASKSTRRKGTVVCTGCKLRQHKQCTGFNPNYVYYCPPCWTRLSVIPSCATLIVVPQPIFGQWLSEIERHVPSMKVFAYRGVDRFSFVQPTDLVTFDVVITTYDTLSSETLYTFEAPERSRRREERYLRQMCPLTKVGWWRIVCDEAQLFESDNARIQQMIPLLTSEHRWSVTGTPIQRSIADLFYLTQFMSLGCLDDKAAWINLLLKPYLAGCKEPLLAVLSQVFWRSSKEDVFDELGLPEQTFVRHVLKFSAIEETFYEQERQNSATKLQEAICKSRVDRSRTLDSLDRSTLKKILTPLLNLRQACSHPQAVKGLSLNSSSGAANLGDLLSYLSRKAKQECEEGLRRYIAALNGMAGLYILRGEYPQSIECYREVFKISEEYKEKVKVDTLQRIHALSNAALILQDYPENISPTLRDDKLNEEVEELEMKYRSKVKSEFESSFSSFQALHKEVSDLGNAFESAPRAYWLPIALSLRPLEGDFFDRLNELLDSNDLSEKEKAFLRANMSSLRGLEIAIDRWCTSLSKNYERAAKALIDLTKISVHILVNQATACHLRSAPTEKTRCPLCKVERQMQDLECDLFATKRKEKRIGKPELEANKIIDGAETKGSWKASKEERALIIMVNFARSKVTVEPWALADFKIHTKMLDTMKKEFKQLRAAWTQLNQLVQVEDELAMARLRLRLAEEGEMPPKASALSLTQPNKTDTIHIVHWSQIEPMLVDLSVDRDLSLSIFRKRFGRMMYLEKLGINREATPDPCPVCSLQLDKQWIVLECGHCFCLECIKKLCSTKIKCPVCREETETRNLSVVDKCLRTEDKEILVHGDFPTKVDAIVGTALKLLKEDPTTKIIIFSTWPEVLVVLEKALKLNYVSLLRLVRGKHQKILEQFRDPEGNISILLLPLSWGARGLNLVEATHVFLTEPILNPSVELQAIGRVHRIGQLKKTTVHRFLISRTVEEKIQTAVSEAKDKWRDQRVSLNDLQDLFTMVDQGEPNSS